MRAGEFYECVLLADWLDKRQLLFTHFPAGEMRDRREVIRKGKLIRFSPAGQKLERMGMRRAVSDYFIFERPPKSPYYVSVVIEMKAKKEDGGRPPSPEQLEFLHLMSLRGYATNWFYGADLAIRWLEELGWDQTWHKGQRRTRAVVG